MTLRVLYLRLKVRVAPPPSASCRTNLSACNRGTVLEELRTASADVVFNDAPAAAPDLRVRGIGGDELLAVIPPGHALASHREIGWDELAQEPFIVLEPGTSLGVLTDRAFARAAAAPRRGIEQRRSRQREAWWRPASG